MRTVEQYNIDIKNVIFINQVHFRETQNTKVLDNHQINIFLKISYSKMG
jgi:hypothetical protein